MSLSKYPNPWTVNILLAEENKKNEGGAAYDTFYLANSMAAYMDSLVLTFFFLEIDFLWILKQSGVIDILRQRTSLKPIFIFPFCQNQASANFWKSRYSYHLKYQYNTLLKSKFSYFMKPNFFLLQNYFKKSLAFDLWIKWERVG